MQHPLLRRLVLAIRYTIQDPRKWTKQLCESKFCGSMTDFVRDLILSGRVSGISDKYARIEFVQKKICCWDVTSPTFNSVDILRWVGLANYKSTEGQVNAVVHTVRRLIKKPVIVTDTDFETTKFLLDCRSSSGGTHSIGTYFARAPKKQSVARKKKAPPTEEIASLVLVDSDDATMSDANNQ